MYGISHFFKSSGEVMPISPVVHMAQAILVLKQLDDGMQGQRDSAGGL